MRMKKVTEHHLSIDDCQRLQFILDCPPARLDTVGHRTTSALGRGGLHTLNSNAVGTTMCQWRVTHRGFLKVVGDRFALSTR
jgi:hypothetical protein